jgi:hypothetical protein
MNEISEKENLETLLSEPIASVVKREQSTFDDLAVPFEKSLVLFGAGGLGKKTLTGLRRIGMEPLAFADNNPVLWGKEIDGVKVLSLKDAAEKFRFCAFGDLFVLFTSIQFIFLGIIGGYISTIYVQVLKRPLVYEKVRLNF